MSSMLASFAFWLREEGYLIATDEEILELEATFLNFEDGGFESSFEEQYENAQFAQDTDEFNIVDKGWDDEA